MIRTLVTSSLLVLFIATVALADNTTATAPLQEITLASSAMPAPRPAATPPTPVPGRDFPRPQPIPQQPLPDCKPDAYGQMRCTTPTGPGQGSACKTTTGANGILVQPSANAPSLVCAKTGDACFMGAVAGKVFGTTTLVCAAKGNQCPAASGVGRVFQQGADLVCLGLGEGCACTTPSTGCRVMGQAGNFQSFECALKEVSCPSPSQAQVVLKPTNGQANPAVVPVAANMTTDPTAVSCAYALIPGAWTVNYSMSCPNAALSTIDRHWLACGSSTANVKCDDPEGAVATLAPAAVSAMGPGVPPPAAMVSTPFLQASRDEARTTGYCVYQVHTLTVSTRIPCNTPQIRGSSYRCY
jgi:hypothetical protein